MAFMTLTEGIDWLYHQTVDHPRQGLDAMHQALAYFNNPHRNLPVIHITGTNGKGSTTAFLTQLLREHDQTTVAITSPHIMVFNERYQLNGQNIDDATLLELINQVREYNEYCQQIKRPILSTYEIITLLGILFAARIQPDVVLAEVGIGGLLDTTNVLDGQVAVITTIGLDHADKLGETLEEVAFQKAGIIKSSAHVVTGRIDSSPLKVIEEYAERQHAQIYKMEDDFYVASNIKTMEWNYTFKQWHFSNLPCSLLGYHQFDNAAVALTSFITWMNRHNLEVKEEKIRHALGHTYWMARMEKISEQPLIYLDGAHNEAGLETLADTLSTYFPHKNVTILFAGLDTKNQQEHIQLLTKMHPEKVYLTTFGHPNAFTLEQFQHVLNNEVEEFEYVYLTEDWQKVVDDYISSQGENKESLLLVTGSLYFVSDVRTYLVKK